MTILIIILGMVLAVLTARGGSVRNRAFRRIFALSLVGMMTLLALAPDATSTVAEWLGVGRGADLLLYVLLIYIVFLSLLLWKEVASIRSRMASLVSEIALMNKLVGRSGQDLTDRE